jgi:hypothetical protein
VYCAPYVVQTHACRSYCCLHTFSLCLPHPPGTIPDFLEMSAPAVMPDSMRPDWLGEDAWVSATTPTPTLGVWQTQAIR